MGQPSRRAAHVWRSLPLPLALAVGGGACDELGDGGPPLDFAFYRCRVQPVLEDRCAMPACHGDARRPLAIYARSRLRAIGEPFDAAPLERAEIELNYVRASSFATWPPDAALLADKPLDERAGGSFHRGREMFGGDDVFVTTADPGYQTLLSWIAGELEDPTCDYAGET